jgi:hypothetical protein
MYSALKSHLATEPLSPIDRLDEDQMVPVAYEVLVVLYRQYDEKMTAVTLSIPVWSRYRRE